MEEQTSKFLNDEQSYRFVNQMSLNQMFEDDPELDHLVSVEYLVDLDLTCPPEAIVLNFERYSFTVNAIAEDDTIEIIPEKIKPNSEQTLISVSEDEPWSKVIGSFVGWSWALINNQGYPDAVQFEFIKDQEGDLERLRTIIQLVTVASSIDIYELNRIEY